MNVVQRLQWLFSQLDKQAHALGGALIFAMTVEATLPLGWWSVVLGLAVAAVLMAAKERWDAQHVGHTKDWWDARAGLIGALVMAAYMLVLAPSVRYFLRALLA